MPMPNTKAPITSDGPSGAMDPPYLCDSAATGTTASAHIAITIKPPSRPPASPRVRNRRQAAVKLNSALRKATPSPKPPRISAADAGCWSSNTSATRMAVAPRASPRNRRSIRTAAPGSDAAKLAVDMETPERRSGSEAKRLFQIVPLRARGFNRAAGIAGPLDHGAGIEPGLFPAEQFVHDEPVGRRPVAGVAVIHHRPGSHGV